MKVFILAGVGDHTGYIKRKTRDWESKYGLVPIPLKFGWRGDYASNYKKLHDFVVQNSDGDEVALVGISAGASAALRLASELKNASCVVTICGRTSHGGFKLWRFKRYHAYKKSVDHLSSSNPNQSVLVIKPLFDEVVSTSHMDTRGAKVLRVKYILHIPSILMILAKKSDKIADFINRA